MLTNIERATNALFALNADLPRDEWWRYLASAKDAGVDKEAAREWSAQSDRYSASDFESTWRSIKTGGGITGATLFQAARAAGWSDSAPRRPLPAHAQQSKPEPEREIRETLAPQWLAYWQSLGAVHDVGRAYLEARQCALPPADGDLRYDPAARHSGGYTGPCLVALVTDALSSAPISLHRTWVNADGTKASVEPPRMLLGGHRKAGGVIRLWPDEALTHGLAVAEGIETALSLARVFQPAWALIDAGNLAKLPALAGVEALTIAVDEDAAGRQAAHTCAERWAVADREAMLVEAGHGA